MQVSVYTYVRDALIIYKIDECLIFIKKKKTIAKMKCLFVISLNLKDNINTF